MFGPHLIMEAYGCPKETLMNRDILNKLLDDLVIELKMTKIMGPTVFNYSGVVPEDCGVTGIVIIAESHIAIHTFEEKGFVAIDIFSCKEFDEVAAISKIIEAYMPTHWDQQLIQRGREFPKSMTKAKLILESERAQIRNTQTLQEVS